jgi:hypothetical protein
MGTTTGGISLFFVLSYVHWSLCTPIEMVGAGAQCPLYVCTLAVSFFLRVFVPLLGVGHRGSLSAFILSYLKSGERVCLGLGCGLLHGLLSCRRYLLFPCYGITTGLTHFPLHSLLCCLSPPFPHRSSLF